MFDRIAVIGDSDFMFVLQAMGIKVHFPKTVQDAREIMKSIERENIALCFLHQSYFESLKPEREALEEKLCPVIVGFSDYREVADHLEQMMRDMAIKATGSDSLVRRRGKDETR